MKKMASEKRVVVTDWVSVASRSYLLFPQRRKNFSWLNGHRPEPE